MSDLLRARSEYPVKLDPDGGNTAISRFASGRRRHNRRRQFAALSRRVKVAHMLAGTDPAELRYGFKSRAAKELGVHRSTIARDLKTLRKTALQPEIPQ